MFEVGFTELLLIFGLALIVLGPHRLPQIAAQVGRWVGRARAMARQLREQLDQEVNFEEAPHKTKPVAPAPPASESPSDPNPDLQAPHERPGQ